MKLLHKYQNGNATIELFSDGTRVTEWPDNESLKLDYPLNVDIRLMTKCPYGLNPRTGKAVCSFCHESATTDGKVVIRPDSGDPVKIICGDPNAEPDTCESVGLIESLWVIFGGKINSKGYKVLDPHIGAIYGDSITLDRFEEILKQLKEKGFASSNIVVGVGSYTYQYNTRDTFGFAVKSTYSVVNEKERFLFKDPKTDDGTKRSQRGMVAVLENGTRFVDELKFFDYQELAHKDELKEVFRNGELEKHFTLDKIRANIDKELELH